MAILDTVKTFITGESKPEPVELVSPMKSSKVEEYKAPEYTFPNKEPGKQETLDALIHALRLSGETNHEDQPLDPETLVKFKKILKILGKN